MTVSGWRIAVLDCATLPETLKDAHGSVGRLVAQWLAPVMPSVAFTRIAVAAGESLPEPHAFDAYILPGSEQGVYDTPPWMAALQPFLLSLRDKRIPLVGICFGHQLMAETFGGRAVNVGLGMCTGVREFTVDGNALSGHVLHQDQVVEVPPDATVKGSADYCPNAVLQYDFLALSFQFHPEYTSSFMANAVDVLEGTALSDSEAQSARLSLDQKPPQDLYAREVRAFFERNLGTD